MYQPRRGFLELEESEPFLDCTKFRFLEKAFEAGCFRLPIPGRLCFFFLFLFFFS